MVLKLLDPIKPFSGCDWCHYTYQKPKNPQILTGRSCLSLGSGCPKLDPQLTKKQLRMTPLPQVMHKLSRLRTVDLENPYGAYFESCS